MYKQTAVICFVGLMALSSCTFYESLFDSEPESPITQSEHTLYWNAEAIGQSVLTKDRSSSLVTATVKEVISYTDQKYTFIFELGQSLKNISVFQHNNNSEGYMPGNSYKLYLSEDAIRRVSVGRDENSIRDETVITDPTKVAYTKNLFRDLTQRLMTYYGYYLFDSKNNIQYEQIQSQGFYLLTHRKL